MLNQAPIDEPSTISDVATREPAMVPIHGDAPPLRAEAAGPIQLSVRPKTVAIALCVMVAVLVTVGTVANLVIYQVLAGPEDKAARIFNRFDLGHEPSIPAYYSSFALLAAAALLGVIAVGERRRRSETFVYWTTLSILFVGLSLDEMVMFHEMFVNLLRDRFDLHGVFYFSWVIPGGILVLTVALYYIRFLFRLDRRTRKLFVLAAGLFVGGALGMEMIAGIVVERHGVASIGHTIVQSIEETGEMLGVVVFIYALLAYIEQNWPGVRIGFGSRPTQVDVR